MIDAAGGRLPPHPAFSGFASSLGAPALPLLSRKTWPPRVHPAGAAFFAPTNLGGRDMKLVIAEKPMLARDIARAI